MQEIEQMGIYLTREQINNSENLGTLLEKYLRKFVELAENKDGNVYIRFSTGLEEEECKK